jgi:hypothetical protein
MRSTKNSLRSAVAASAGELRWDRLPPKKQKPPLSTNIKDSLANAPPLQMDRGLDREVRKEEIKELQQAKNTATILKQMNAVSLDGEKINKKLNDSEIISLATDPSTES